jgi:hypothetical protein
MANTYWIVCPNSDLERTKDRNVPDWLLAETAEDGAPPEDLSLHSWQPSCETYHHWKSL